MTNVILYKSNKKYIGYEISGHANYSKHGDDILCSAISILSFSCTNTILKELKLDVDYEEDEHMGFLKLIVKDNLSENMSEKLHLVIVNMKIGIDGLIEQYPKHIKIEMRRLGWLN